MHRLIVDCIAAEIAQNETGQVEVKATRDCAPSVVGVGDNEAEAITAILLGGNIAGMFNRIEVELFSILKKDGEYSVVMSAHNSVASATDESAGQAVIDTVLDLVKKELNHE